MNCHFCGNSLGISRTTTEADFCSSSHRAQFEARLTKGLVLLRGEGSRIPKVAGPLAQLLPVDIVLRSPLLQSSDIIRNVHLGVYAAAIDLDLTEASLWPMEAGLSAAEKNPEPVLNLPVAIRADCSSKLDRIEVLGSRLRALRTQLHQASGIRQELATA